MFITNLSTWSLRSPYRNDFDRILIFRTPQYVIQSFDYTACQFAYDFTNLYCGDTSLRDLGQRIIKIVSISNQNPLALTKRLLKYIKRGFTIDDRTLQNFLLNISKMDFSSTEPWPNYSTVVDNPFAEIVQDDW